MQNVTEVIDMATTDTRLFPTASELDGPVWMSSDYADLDGAPTLSGSLDDIDDSVVELIVGLSTITSLSLEYEPMTRYLGSFHGIEWINDGINRGVLYLDELRIGNSQTINHSQNKVGIGGEDPLQVPDRNVKCIYISKRKHL